MNEPKTIEGMSRDGKMYRIQIAHDGVVRWVDLQVIRKGRAHWRNLHVGYGPYAKPMSEQLLAAVTLIRKEQGV